MHLIWSMLNLAYTVQIFMEDLLCSWCSTRKLHLVGVGEQIQNIFSFCSGVRMERSARWCMSPERGEDTHCGDWRWVGSERAFQGRWWWVQSWGEIGFSPKIWECRKRKIENVEKGERKECYSQQRGTVYVKASNERKHGYLSNATSSG